ncbi:MULTISPECIES: sigma-54 interaction domain-containing protein [Shouchella]|uniref:Sigma-54-dependent Fis family transcriptional regulator n=2 Tax=Shouchella TaxID=2893057 RepID=A0ABY7W8I3_9BACI|nr:MULTISPECIES: sigma-54-dependent Fis family transcriptional regulator [Shouchella]MED4127499.1 sigma-54-dependent Fis family transcriptional regulator [Shouchella miscanthi]WDF03944.1 sigma-54-dependent Fis family transcriptional regulator [Shouchella hunanensis]GAF22680.1 transcriptional regulator BkdR of isoleucine and valine catabolism operon [Bacillus sp. JCM 19047]
MNKILFIDDGPDAFALLRCLTHLPMFTVAAIHSKTAKINAFAAEHNIDLMDEQSFNQHDFTIIQRYTKIGTTAETNVWSYEETWGVISAEFSKQSLMQKAIDSIDDGVIIVKADYTVMYLNDAAAEMADVNRHESVGQAIQSLLPTSGLPRVIERQQPEYNQLQTFANGTKIVTTRMPLSTKGTIRGAIAVFKDVTEARQMAEQITDLNRMREMLEAIINSSNDAISVVDEFGVGLLINPAYKKITGLTEEQVIGKPATTDISEGESIHMQVLQTQRPVRGARLKLGPAKRDVIVNVAPIIVDKKLKGSIGVIHDVSELNSLMGELKQAKKKIASLEANYTFQDILGQSNGIQHAIAQGKLGANTDLPILLLGETGTGKELFAHAIHYESERRHQPFVRVNCAALTETLLESELFGYEQGAFSGALRTGKKGLFEEAGEGSIFLDEVGEMSLQTQAKLLRVLQESEVVRVGGTKPIKIKARVIAATNVNLQLFMSTKRFREDLYYRLNTLPIYIPPLRERIEDIPILALRLIEKINEDYGRNIRNLSDYALAQLQQYAWPGNIRELENVLAREMIYKNLGETEIDFVAHADISVLKPGSAPKVDRAKPEKLEDFLAEQERGFLLETLAHVHYVKTEAAKRLGISVRSLYYKLEKYGIE